MQLAQLGYFVAVADTRHFTRAAQRVHVAQPSLSAQIQALERELGARLLVRTRGNITLTDAGETLLPLARRMLADAERARRDVQELVSLRRGRLRLGATPSMITGLLPPVLAGYHRQHPAIELTVHEGGSRYLVDKLATGAVDVALVILPISSADLVTALVLHEDLVLAGHSLDTAQVAIADLRGRPLVLPHAGYDLREMTVAACRAAGFEPTIAIEGGEMDAVLAFVRAGLGAAMLPATVVAQAGLHATPLRPPGLHRAIAIAHRRDVAPPHTAVAFESALREHLAHAALPAGVTSAT